MKPQLYSANKQRQAKT